VVAAQYDDMQPFDELGVEQNSFRVRLCKYGLDMISGEVYPNEVVADTTDRYNVEFPTVPLQYLSVEKPLLWYSRAGCYVNVVHVIIVLVLILDIAQGSGLCVTAFKIPNPFDQDQLGRRPLSSDKTCVCEQFAQYQCNNAAWKQEVKR
jgi:hypothetical protein